MKALNDADAGHPPSRTRAGPSAGLPAARALALAALLVAGGCGPAGLPPDHPAPVATMRQLMLSLTAPMADIVWGVGSEEPREDREWVAIEHGALALAESGNLLLMPGRVRAEGVWIPEARALVDAASRAARAAAARDVDAVLEAGDAIYLTCEGCHQEFLPR
jgi:hypothetical protein